MNIPPHSANLRRYRRSDGCGTFFVTKSLWPKRNVNDVNALALPLLETLAFQRGKGRAIVGAFVVMPDHWHALLGINEGFGLGMVMQSINRYVSGRTKGVLDPYCTRWEEGYFDTRIVSTRQFAHIWSYIEYNPVRKGLAVKPEGWQWSSAHAMNASLVTCPWPTDFERDHPH